MRAKKDKNKQKGKRFYRKFISHTLALPFSYLIPFQSFPLYQLSCPYNRQADDDDDGGIIRIRIILYTKFMDGDGDAFCGDGKKTNCWILIYNIHEMRLFMWISCIIWMYDNNACRFYCIFFLQCFVLFLYLLNTSIAHIISKTFFSVILGRNFFSFYIFSLFCKWWHGSATFIP